MSTFQLNVKSINEAESEIKFIIITLSEIQNQLNSQISRLDSCFVCSANYEVKNKLSSVSSNQIASVSDNLSQLINTLEEISETAGKYEKKAASDTLISDIIKLVSQMLDEFFIDEHYNTFDWTLGTTVLDFLSKQFGGFSNTVDFLKKYQKYFSPEVLKLAKGFGALGTASSIFSSLIQNSERLASDGRMSNRDLVKLSADTVVDVGVDAVGDFISGAAGKFVTGAILGGSCGTLAPLAPIAGVVVAGSVSVLYDNTIKEPLSEGLKYITENTIDFVADNHVLEKYVDMKVNTVETGGEIIKTAINKGGDGIQSFASNVGHAVFGDGYDNVDKGIDYVQQTITSGVDATVNGARNVGNAIKGIVGSMFSN